RRVHWACAPVVRGFAAMQEARTRNTLTKRSPLVMWLFTLLEAGGRNEAGTKKSTRLESLGLQKGMCLFPAFSEAAGQGFEPHLPGPRERAGILPEECCCGLVYAVCERVTLGGSAPEKPPITGELGELGRGTRPL